MKKTPLVFIFDYENQILTSQIKPGSEWVFQEDSIPTIKFDGTAALWKDNKLWKRFDRKLSPSGMKFVQKNPDKQPNISHFRNAPEGFIPCEENPDPKTYHWPGWVPVSKDKPEDKHFREALEKEELVFEENATYELVGPAFANNPYNLSTHELWKHASVKAQLDDLSFDGICRFMRDNVVEGIVFHNKDGRVAKIRRKDFLLVADRYLHWKDIQVEQLQNVDKPKIKI